MGVFVGDDDYRLCIELMSASCRERGGEAWAHCLMPNHVNLPDRIENLLGRPFAPGSADRKESGGGERGVKDGVPV